MATGEAFKPSVDISVVHEVITFDDTRVADGKPPHHQVSTFASASSRAANRRALPHHLPDESAITSAFQLNLVSLSERGCSNAATPANCLLTGARG